MVICFWDNQIKFATSQYQTLENADALIIATEWSEFRTPDFELMDQQLKQNKIIFDGRTLYNYVITFIF